MDPLVSDTAIHTATFFDFAETEENNLECNYEDKMGQYLPSAQEWHKHAVKHVRDFSEGGWAAHQLLHARPSPQAGKCQPRQACAGG